MHRKLVLTFSIVFMVLMVFGVSVSAQDLEAPVPVSPEHLANVPGDSVTLEWEAVEGAMRYRVLVMDLTDRDNIERHFFVVQGGDNTTYELEGLADEGRAYRWLVIAGNADGFNAPVGWSEPRNVINGELPGPVPVLPASGDFVSGEAVDFSWEAVPGALRYILVVRNTDTDEDFVRVPVVGATSYTVDGFEDDGTNYMWRVCGINRGVRGDLSFPAARFVNREEEKLEVDSVEAIIASVEYGTSEEEVRGEFPAEVTATLDDESTITVRVEWEPTSSPVYAPETAGDYVFEGELVDLPEGVINTGEIKVIATVTVEAPRLTINKEGEGILEVNGEEVQLPFSGEFEGGSTVELKAVDGFGWEFYAHMFSA